MKIALVVRYAARARDRARVVLRGQRQRLRSVPAQRAGHRRRPAAPHPVQAARGLTWTGRRASKRRSTRRPSNPSFVATSRRQTPGRRRSPSGRSSTRTSIQMLACSCAWMARRPKVVASGRGRSSSRPSVESTGQPSTIRLTTSTGSGNRSSSSPGCGRTSRPACDPCDRSPSTGDRRMSSGSGSSP